jgi:hypothetical protein
MKKITLLFLVLSLIMSVVSANPVQELSNTMTVVDVIPGDAYIPKGTMIPGELLTAVNSGSNKTGDPISFKVLEDVSIGDVIVLAKGTVGQGYVKSAKKAGLFGKGGSLELDASNVTTVTGVDVPLTMDFSKVGGDHPVELNYNNSIAGAVISGLIPGSNKKIAAGTKITIFVPVNVDLQVKSEDLTTAVAKANNMPAEVGGKAFIQAAPNVDTPYVAGAKWSYAGSNGIISFAIKEVGKNKIKGMLTTSGGNLLIFDQAYEANKTNQFISVKAKSKDDGKTYMVQIYFRSDGTIQYVIPNSPKGDRESIILNKQQL